MCLRGFVDLISVHSPTEMADILFHDWEDENISREVKLYQMFDEYVDPTSVSWSLISNIYHQLHSLRSQLSLLLPFIAFSVWFMIGVLPIPSSSIIYSYSQREKMKEKEKDWIELWWTKWREEWRWVNHSGMEEKEGEREEVVFQIDGCSFNVLSHWETKGR